MTINVSADIKAEILQSGAALTAAAQTSSVDLLEKAHQGFRVKVATVNTLAAGVNDMGVQVQHSDNGTDWEVAEYTEKKLLSSVAEGEELELPYEGIKRYARLSYTVEVGAPDVEVDSYAIVQPYTLPAK